MGNRLHSVGAYAFRHSWHIIIGWIIVLGILGGLAAHYIKPTTSTVSIPGTEAQKAIDRTTELFPHSGKGAGRIVFASRTSATLLAQQSAIETMLARIQAVDGVVAVVSPFENPTAMSRDKRIAYAQVQLKSGTGSIKASTSDKISEIVNKTRSSKLQVELGGDVVTRVPNEILGTGEVGGVILALVVLLITLGSLLAAGMPIATALIAIGTSMAGLFALSDVVTISSTTPVLAVMLGLAVGIDYSLFIISKYRTYALEGYGYADAAAKALGTAGNAVVFAAGTVVIALSSLAVVNIPFMTTMGLAGAATIAVAAMVAITLIPALLGLAGARVFRGKTRQKIEAAQKQGVRGQQHVDYDSIWYRWGKIITRRPLAVLIIATLLVVGIALPVKDLHLGLPTDEYAAKQSSERKAYDLLSKGFGAGFNGPLTVLVEGLPAVSEADRQAIRVPAMTEYHKQVEQKTLEQQQLFAQKAAEVTTPQQYAALQQQMTAAQAEGAKQQQAALAKIEASVHDYAKLVQLKKIADSIAKLRNVDQAQPALATGDGTKGIIQVTPRSAPSDAATSDLITYLRSSRHQQALTSSNRVMMAVTGSTALQLDINQKLSAALPVYLVTVVGLSLILLILAFRSILVPIKATLGFLLSVLAMFGAIVAVFQWGWFGLAGAPGPIVSFIPIIAIGVLFGLAMDYEFFLVSSMHESYRRGGDANKAVVDGFGLGSKVVTAAGVIMISVFTGFIFNHDAIIQAIGFGLAVGILVDAFIVRMTIVPAVMMLLGKSAWWIPAWLDRLLPHVSIEGEDETKRS